MGGAIAVAEAARNVACTGARPIAMTNCLNFGNPEKPEVYHQVKEAIRGMADAARALGIPVISGNVSLYNETNGEAIWPTPVAGMVGLLEDASRVVGMGFRDSGDVIFIAGATPDAAGFAGSEYLRLVHGTVAGQPGIDLDAEARLHRFLVDAADAGLLRSAHDAGPGGLAVAFAESCMAGGAGAEIDTGVSGAALFAEMQSSVVMSCRPGDASALERLATQKGVALRRSGVVGGEGLRIGVIDVPVTELREAYESGLAHALEGVAANV